MQVREEVAKESGIYIPKQSTMLHPSYLMTDPFFGPSMPPRAINGHPTGQHSDNSGMRDMVSMVPSLYAGECADVSENSRPRVGHGATPLPLFLHFPTFSSSTLCFSVFYFSFFPLSYSFYLFSCFSIPSHSTTPFPGQMS